MIATKRKSRMPSDCEIEAGSKILLCATTFRRSIFVIIKQVNKLEIRYEFGRKKKTRKKGKKIARDMNTTVKKNINEIESSGQSHAS